MQHGTRIVRTLETSLALALTVGALVVATAPAKAQSMSCSAAVRQTQSDASGSPRLTGGNSRGGHFQTLLAQAGAAGLRGDDATCMRLITQARGVAGLRPL